MRPSSQTPDSHLLLRHQPTLLCSGPLGGSWVGISGVISPLICVITRVTLLITPHITTHEPPSTVATFCVLLDPSKNPLNQTELRKSQCQGLFLALGPTEVGLRAREPRIFGDEGQAEGFSHFNQGTSIPDPRCLRI